MFIVHYSEPISDTLTGKQEEAKEGKDRSLKSYQVRKNDFALTNLCLYLRVYKSALVYYAILQGKGCFVFK